MPRIDALPVICTPRLVLRDPLEAMGRDSLAKACLEAFSDPEQGRFMIAVPEPYGPAEAEAFVSWLERAKERLSDIELGVFLEGRFSGMVALDEYDPELGSAELGYWLRRDLHGRGLASEAAAALVEWGFSGLGLQRIFACVTPGNEPSLRLLEGLDFRREGLLRRHALCKGRPVDRHYLGLLREEWPGLPRR